MLQSTFKTAQDLHLPDNVYQALVEVLYMLESGELKHHVFGKKMYAWRDEPLPTKAFNMAYFTACCDTVHCIGGWVRVLTHMEPAPGEHLPWEHQHEFHNLCFPMLLEEAQGVLPTTNYKDITTAQAAQAVRNYLTTGEAQWSKVLS